MPPLKGIPRILPADLLWALSSMGHGDEIVLADVNFPAYSTAKANGAKFIDMSAAASTHCSGPHRTSAAQLTPSSMCGVQVWTRGSRCVGRHTAALPTRSVC